MNITLHLILAHFLADYPLQSNWLAKYKAKSPLGILLHSLTHFAISALLALPFICSGKLWWGVTIIFVTHYISDEVKVNLQKKTGWHPFWLYSIDQIIHLIIIYGVSAFYLDKMATCFSGAWATYYGDYTMVSFLLILTLVTYFYDITRWTLLGAPKKEPYKRDYPMMARNALIVVIAFIVYWMTK